MGRETLPGENQHEGQSGCGQRRRPTRSPFAWGEVRPKLRWEGAGMCLDGSRADYPLPLTPCGTVLVMQRIQTHSPFRSLCPCQVSGIDINGLFKTEVVTDQRRLRKLAQATQLVANQPHSPAPQTSPNFTDPRVRWASQVTWLSFLMVQMKTLRTKEVKWFFQDHTKVEFRRLTCSSFNQSCSSLKGLCIVLAGEETPKKKNPHVAEKELLL